MKIYKVLVFIVLRYMVLLSVFFIYVIDSKAQVWLPHDNPNPDFYQTQQAFTDYWSNKKSAKGKGVKQFKRWSHFMRARAGTQRHIDHAAYWQAIAEGQQAVHHLNKAGSWQFVGPAVVPLSVAGKPSGIGRVNCLAYHPTNNLVLWAGTPAGGLWKTIDGGNSWFACGDAVAGLGISGIAVHPDNPDILYVATGDADGMNTYSVGVLKSLDGGVTWSLTGLNYDRADNFLAQRIIINPLRPDNLIVSSNLGIYLSTDGGASWQQSQIGSFKSLHYKPGSPNIVYAAQYGYNKNHVMRSTDDGLNFAPLNTGIGAKEAYRVELAVTPALSQVVYAVASREDNDGLLGVYRSLDSGNNWTQVQDGNQLNLLGYEPDGSDHGGQGFYDLCIAVSPFDANELYVGGINIWKSNTGGSTWQLCTHWTHDQGVDYAHADQHTLSFSAGGKLYACNDGGVYASADAGLNWYDMSNGLAIQQLYNVGLFPDIPSYLFTGSQDNGIFRLSNKQWLEAMGGDGMEVIIDPHDRNRVYMMGYYGNLMLSADGGLNYEDIAPVPQERCPWQCPLLMHPQEPGLLFGGFDDVYQSADKGKSWTNISTGVFNEDREDFAEVLALAAHPTDANMLCAVVFYNWAYSVWITSTGGNSWQNITPAGNSSSYSSVCYDPANADKLWLSVSGYEAKHKVLKTKDGGLSWTDCSAGIPNVPVNHLVCQAQANELLYAATDMGVYLSTAGSSWSLFANGLPQTVVRELEINYNEQQLYAATFGRGLWKAPLYDRAPTGPYVNFRASQDFVTPGGELAFTDLSSGAVDTWLWAFEGGRPNSSTAQHPRAVVYETPGTYKVSLSVSGANGTQTKTREQYIRVSEDIHMGNGSLKVCSGTLYDDGGRDGNYTSGTNYVLTLLPNAEQKHVGLGFDYFNVEGEAQCNYDRLSVYDGTSTSAPLLGTYCGTNLPPNFVATNIGGALTLEFLADDVGSVGGWIAQIGCIDTLSFSPLNLRATTNHTNVLLRWFKPNSPENPVGYKVYRNSVLLDSIAGAATTTYTDAALDTGTYRYWVTALYSSPVRESTPTDTLSVLMKPLAAAGQVLDKPFALRPNPNSGLFDVVFSFASSTDATIRVIGPAGNQYYNHKLVGLTHLVHQINLEKKTPGLYVLQICTPDARYHETFMVQ